MDRSELPTSIPKESRVLQRRTMEEWTFEYRDDNKEKKYDTVTVETMDAISERGKTSNTKITRKTFNTMSEALGGPGLEHGLEKEHVSVDHELTLEEKKNGLTRNEEGAEYDASLPQEKLHMEQSVAPNTDKKRARPPQYQTQAKEDPPNDRHHKESWGTTPSTSTKALDSSDVTPSILTEKSKTPSETTRQPLKEGWRNSSDQQEKGLRERATLPQTREDDKLGSPSEPGSDILRQSLKDRSGLVRKESTEARRIPRGLEEVDREVTRRKSSRLDEYQGRAQPRTDRSPQEGVKNPESGQYPQRERKVSEIKEDPTNPPRYLPGGRPTVADDDNGLITEEERESRSGSRRSSGQGSRKTSLSSSPNNLGHLTAPESTRKPSGERTYATLPDHSLVLEELRQLQSNSGRRRTGPPKNMQPSQSRLNSLPYQERRDPGRTSESERLDEPKSLSNKDSESMGKNTKEVGFDYSEEEEEEEEKPMASRGKPSRLPHEDGSESSEDEDSDPSETSPPLPPAFLKKLQAIAEQWKKTTAEGSVTSSENASEPTSRRSSLTKDDFARDVLTAHNEYRRMHGVKPLKLSSELSRFSQSWAETIAKKDELIHSTGSGYGENIYCTSGHVSGTEPVDSWYGESLLHTYGSNYFNPATGHFTQLIWKGSKVLGVGIARSPHGGSYVVVNYYPPGNIQTKFKSNVFPPKMDDYYT